jgi:hypothetical protein
MPSPWFSLSGSFLVLFDVQHVRIQTASPFVGPLSPSTSGLVAFSDPVYVGARGDEIWVGEFLTSPSHGGNCFSLTGAALGPASNATVELPAGSRWIITAWFCNGHNARRIETLAVDLSCHADINADGAVNVEDLAAFLVGFEAGHALADLTADGVTFGPDGGVDVADLLFFLGVFEAGC